jgi:hypothetical protein
LSETKKLPHAGPIADALEALITTKVKDRIVINQKGYLVIVARDADHRNEIKPDLSRLTTKHKYTEHELVVVDYGDLNKGKPPVWLT